MRRGWQRLLPRLVAACLLAVTLSGCRLDAVVEVALDRDGSGRLEVELVADRALMTRAAASGVDPFEELVRRLDGARGWAVQQGEAAEGGRRVRLAAGFPDAAAFDALMAQFTQALGAPELRALESLRLEREGERVRLAGVASLRPAPEVAELGFTPEQAVARLRESVSYQVRLRVPGEVIDTNADRSADGELVWQVPAGERVEILAEAALPRPRVLPLVAGGALAAALTGWWLSRRGAA